MMIKVKWEGDMGFFRNLIVSFLKFVVSERDYFRSAYLPNLLLHLSLQHLETTHCSKLDIKEYFFDEQEPQRSLNLTRPSFK